MENACAKLLAESSYDHVSEDISNDLFGRAAVTGRGRLALCEGVYDFQVPRGFRYFHCLACATISPFMPILRSRCCVAIRDHRADCFFLGFQQHGIRDRDHRRFLLDGSRGDVSK